MKQLLFTTIAAACLTLSIDTYAQENQASTGNATVKAKTKADKAKRKESPGAMQQAVAMAYTPTYSSQFVMGNPAHSQLVMHLIKDYETNTFSMVDAFADTVVVVFPNGNVVRGTGPMTEAFKQLRASIAEPKIRIAAVIPMRSTDRKEDWVLVWGSSDDNNGTSEFHHIWRLNRSGKVDYMQMFEGKPPAAQ